MKSKNYVILALIFTGALFSSCAKLPVYQSKRVNPPVQVDARTKIASQNDAKKSVDYGLAYDDENLYLQLCFHDQKSMSRMLDGGLNIYFDNSGKKKKDCVLAIESSADMKPGGGPGGMQGPGGGQMGEKSGGAPQGGGQQGRPDMQESGNRQGPGEMQESQGMTENIPMQVSKKMNSLTLTKNENEITFYSPMYHNKVELKMEPYNFTQLMMTLKIPFSEIDVQSGDKLALGIETGKPDSDSSDTQGGSQQGGMEGGMSGGMGGGPGGGGPGGGMGMNGGPGGGGPGGSGSPGGMQEGGMGGSTQGSSSSGKAFKFWFLTNL